MQRTLVLAAIAAGSLMAGAAVGQPDRGYGGPPRGSYVESCRNISTYGRGEDATVTAQCRDVNGRWRSASLRYGRCDSVDNRDGELVCADRDRPPPWAGGSDGGGSRPGRRGSITLFSAPNFDGRPFQASSEVTNLPKQFNDRAMSLRIEGRGAWQVCSDSDFRGRCQVFDRDVPDLRQFGLGEAVSSMRPAR